MQKWVWIPSGFTLLSNCKMSIDNVAWVWIPSGFTLLSNRKAIWHTFGMFEYPLDLHCSQTCRSFFPGLARLNTLWIYTALKQVVHRKCAISVWIPSGFTLLSNYTYFPAVNWSVWIPSGFTLLSNLSPVWSKDWKVWIPSGFTLLSNLTVPCINKHFVWIPSGFTLLSNEDPKAVSRV